MKTAQEMREYAETIPCLTGVFITKRLDLSTIPFDILEEMLTQNNDEALVAFGCNGINRRSNNGDITRSWSPGCCAITNSKIYFCGFPWEYKIDKSNRDNYDRLILDLSQIPSVESLPKGVSFHVTAENDVECGTYDKTTINKIISLFLDIKKENEMKKEDRSNGIQEKTPVEKIKEYKELLDMGIITQDEFDAKKKQLLGL